MVAAAATGLSWNLASFVLFRFLTGAGIGGEYAAINSTIQELIPGRYRGWTDLAINGSFWVGAALGAGGSLLLLDPAPLRRRSRLAPLLPDRRRAVIGHLRHAALAAGEPPLAPDHGRAEEARQVIEGIEHRFEASGRQLPAGAPARIRFQARAHRPRRGIPQPVLGASAPRPGGAQPDGGPGLLLQRDLLHLRPGADGFLRRAGGQRRLVHPALRRREFPRSPAARASLRHAWGASR